MSAAKHAPGPWVVIPQKTPQGDIATVYNTPDGWVSIHAPTWLNIGDQKVTMANARLIAAAPDLLETLKEIVGFWDSIVPIDCVNDCVNDLHVKARVAIAKATGEAA